MGVQDKTLTAGNTKVTRHDWLTAARDVMLAEGVEAVKITRLSAQLGVSRSSFYWYFKDRDDVLEALLAEWAGKNTKQIQSQCRLPAQTITEGLLNFFMCFVDDALFDHRLDFAVREWARRDTNLRRKVDAADRRRIAAVTDLFLQHGYDVIDADARARIVYFMQLGYHALEVRETMKTRMSRLAPYIQGFTGQTPDEAAIDQFLVQIGQGKPA